MNYYFYCFKSWLLRDEKLTHQEAALGVFLTIVVLACGYYAIHNQSYLAGASEAIVDSRPDTTRTTAAFLPEPYVPVADSSAASKEAALQPPVTNVNVSSKKADYTAAPKRSFKTNGKKTSPEKIAIRLLNEGNTVRQIARKTGLSKKYIREVKRRNKKKG